MVKFAVGALLLDLICLVVAWPAPSAKFLAMLAAIVSVGALLMASIRLNATRNREQRAAADIAIDDLPVLDLADVLPDFDFDD